MTKRSDVAVVIPNWNGLDGLEDCLASLRAQSYPAHIVLVDNGSVDLSVAMVEKKFPEVEIVQLDRNYGFAGGVNAGIRKSLEQKFTYTALFNNDAVAHKDWLKHLVAALQQDTEKGMAACTFMSMDKSHYDSTGDQFTIWGLPYPRGRGESIGNTYADSTQIFSVSGGSSLYRNAVFKRVGLFDEDFFAYYEDVDMSFRARLAGFSAVYAPQAIAYHKIGGTSGKMKGFTTYQSFKNMPIILVKDVPGPILWHMAPRFILAYATFGISALQRGHGLYALKGFGRFLLLVPKKLRERKHIQSQNRVSAQDINQVITHDLPPMQYKLRAIRAAWWKLRFWRKAPAP
jgi:GT2 family glycosyltransferase